MGEAFEPVSIGIISKGAPEEVRVSLSALRGRVQCDVRVYSQYSVAKLYTPSKTGIGVEIEALPELARLIVQAEAKARELGLLSDSAAPGGDV